MFRIQIYEFISGWELCDCWTCAELCDSVFTSVCMCLSGLKPCPLFVPCSLLKQVLPTSTRSVPSFSKWSNMPALPFPITNALFRTTSSLLSIQVTGLFPLPHVYQQSTFVQIRFWDEISFPLSPPWPTTLSPTLIMSTARCSAMEPFCSMNDWSVIAPQSVSHPITKQPQFHYAISVVTVSTREFTLAHYMHFLWMRCPPLWCWRGKLNHRAQSW